MTNGNLACISDDDFSIQQATSSYIWNRHIARTMLVVFVLNFSLVNDYRYLFHYQGITTQQRFFYDLMFHCTLAIKSIALQFSKQVVPDEQLVRFIAGTGGRRWS